MSQHVNSLLSIRDKNPRETKTTLYPNLMILGSLFPAQSVLQLILRNPVELPYEFEDKNVTTCQLAVAD